MTDTPDSKSPDVEVLRSNAVNPPGLPFPDGVQIGDFVILSGQIGNRPGTLELPPGGIEPEARQLFENLRVTLDTHGMKLGDIVRVQVMLADMAEWQRFNAVYLEFFPDASPARCAFGTSGLALGARVEVEAFAVRR
ncbi:MAG: RidA family protein [Pseudorhodoplanes sp.]|uniref:RidA family protein n=1 Tax=Pseudorhodoplanes sp. TaxID=1934341 RepID=UPI003D114B60